MSTKQKMGIRLGGKHSLEHGGHSPSKLRRITGDCGGDEGNDDSSGDDVVMMMVSVMRMGGEKWYRQWWRW